MSNIISRAIGISTKPKAEWAAIDAEPATSSGLVWGYAAIVAAVPAVMSIITGLLFASMMAGILGSVMGGAAAGAGFVVVVVSAALSYVVSLAMVFIMSFIIDALAPSFGGTKDSVQAMKVSAYSMTAIWVASIATIIPFLGYLVVIAAAVWTIFILHWGLKACMKTPDDKAVGYTAVTIIIGIVISFILSAITGTIVGMMTIGSALATSPELYNF